MSSSASLPSSPSITSLHLPSAITDRSPVVHSERASAMNFAFTAPVTVHPLRNTLTPMSKKPVQHARARKPIQAVAEAPSTTSVVESFSDVVMNTYTRYPLAVSHGKGVTLYTVDGTPYLDCVAGIATCTLGHAHPAVVKAVTDQINRVTHVSNLYYIPEQGALASWLVQNSPADKVFFCNSGGEANEAAIKLARKNWHLAHPSDTPGTPVIITAWQSFHGRTLATLTATGQPKYHQNWWPLVPGFEYITFNDIEDLKKVAAKVGDNLAGIMLEALQGEGGIYPGDPEFFREARKICDDKNALLIFDEVQVGVGRTGKLWGFEHTGVEPDIFTLAKGLAGGVPIGAMCCKESCNKFAPGDHASTFGGNPLATAAGVAVGKELLQGGVLNNAKERGEQLAQGLQKIADKFPGVVKEIRGLGLIRGVDLFDLKASDVVSKAMENGLLLVPAGVHVVRFVPALVITKSEVDQVLVKFEQALQGVVSQK